MVELKNVSAEGRRGIPINKFRGFNNGF